MRVALIATGERGAAPPPVVAGRSLVLRQLDFARACGVERVIAYGNGVPEDSLALKHEAERARIAHAAIASAHALVALVDWSDELIILQPGLLPESALAIDALGRGEKVLAIAAGEACTSAWERIDAGLLWAGALVLPGSLVDQLEQLAEDADPHAALLRIALQARLPVERLPPELLTQGRWTRLHPDEDEAALGAARVRRLAVSGAAMAPSCRLAERALVRFAVPLGSRAYAFAAGLALALLLLCASVLAAWFGQPAPAFATLALAVPVLHAARLLDRVGRADFQRPRLPRWLAYLPEAVLLAIGFLAIEGAWFRQLFPPLVLVAALQAMRHDVRRQAITGDRAIGALAVGCAALAGWHEPALMAWALLALAASLAQPIAARRREG